MGYLRPRQISDWIHGLLVFPSDVIHGCAGAYYRRDSFCPANDHRSQMPVQATHPMPYLRSLKFTAPKADLGLSWPVDGLSYVIAFMGPLSAGPIIGMLTRDWSAVAIGFLGGVGITFLNAWWSDRFVDSWIARHQVRLQKGVPRILANIVAFAWAIILCALSMFAPLAVLGSSLFTKIL